MITCENSLRDFFRLFVWYPLRWITSILPPKSSLALFRQMGRCHYHFSNKKRMTVSKNMALLGLSSTFCMCKGIIERYFETHYINQMIIFLLPRLNKKSIQDIHSFENLDILDSELSKKRGCILVHAHFGPVHLPLFHFGLKGYFVMQISYLREPKNLSTIGRLTSFKIRQRYERKIPASFVQVDKFLRPAFKHLENDGLLMITGDGTGMGEFRGRFELFSFLGKKMYFPIGPMLLASKTKSSLIPIFTIQRPSDKEGYVTIIERPILNQLNGEDYSDYIENTKKFVSIFESYLQRYPYHWHFWDELSNLLFYN